MKRPHPDSKIPIIREINRHVYRIWKPKSDGPGFYLYGMLYYYRDTEGGYGDELRPRWFLDGMTPVGPGFVLGELKKHGVKTEKFHRFFRNLELQKWRRERRLKSLKSSASVKLTLAERRACGLI